MLKGYKHVNCPLCGGDDFVVRYPATGDLERERRVEHFCCTSHELAFHDDIVKCNVCGMVYTNPQPEPGSLIDVYTEVEDPLYQEETAARERTFLKSLKQLQKYSVPPGRMLDVGCYTGVFMKVARENGWEVDGLELSRWAAAKAREGGWGNVYEVSLDRVETPGDDELYDAVTLWDVIEHLTEPADVLREAGRLLKPGGVLAVSTHMVDSWAVRFLGTKYPFFMDMHLVHFSRGTMRRMLDECGFEWLGSKTHKRILRTGYFLEKLEHKVKFKPVRGMVKWLGNRKWVAERFIGIGFMGLLNVFARKR